MFQNTFPDLPKLDNENYENIFNVYLDENGYYFYNLLQTVVIPSDLPEGYYDNYSVVYGDTWPFISYKIYNTPNLWWVILSVNNIANPTEQPKPGQQIQILKSRYVTNILNQISVQTN